MTFKARQEKMINPSLDEEAFKIYWLNNKTESRNCQTWNTAHHLHNQILKILLYTTLFEHFQCKMREHFKILHQTHKIYTSIACGLAYYSMSEMF